jgi:hypothetical protein
MCIRGGPNQPLHRNLQWSIVLRNPFVTLYNHFIQYILTINLKTDFRRCEFQFLSVPMILKHRLPLGLQKHPNFILRDTTGGTHHRQKIKIQTYHFNLQDHVQCFGTEKAFCLWNSCLKAQQSTQMYIVTHVRNCIMRSRTSDVACLVRVL